MALGLRLLAIHQFEEFCTFTLETIIEGSIERVSDNFGGGERRDQPTCALGERSSSIGENRAISLGAGELVIIVADAAKRSFLGEHLTREILARLHRVTCK